MQLTLDLATSYARIALGHVTREYPNKPGNVLAGPADARTPQALYPAFYGSFDWHSCVHSCWLLARVLRRFPASPAAAEIEALFDRQLVADKLAAERRNFETNPGFERPYGWAWLLKLAAELGDTRWSPAIAPLAELIAAKFRAFLPRATYAVRAGTHGNTAFALRMAADYPDTALHHALAEAAQRWYGSDRDCPAWDEPGGDDFLSPALIEAEAFRALHQEAFPSWLTRFLPSLAERRPATLFRPAVASDRTDGKIAHLDGLNLSRAWCFRTLAHAQPALAPVLRQAADEHLAASLPHLSTHYMGEHWLATYALLALDHNQEETA